MFNTLKFFAHLLSPCTIKEAISQYRILPTDQLAPCLASLDTTNKQPTPMQPPPSPNHTQTEPKPNEDPINRSPAHHILRSLPTLTLPPPAVQSCPHGAQEGVAVAPSSMPAAGNGLYGIRPSPVTRTSLLKRDSSHALMPPKNIKSQQALPRHPTPAICGAPTDPPSEIPRHSISMQPLPHTMGNTSMTCGTYTPTANSAGTQQLAELKSMP